MFSASANKAKMDRRGAPRQTCSLEALVLPGHRACTVVDQSGGGLRLRFQRPYDGPADLVVVLLASGQAYTASARWNRDGEIGTVIKAQCDLTGLVPGAFAEARQAWRRAVGSDRPYTQRSNDP
jgi:hypothetical protein